MPAPAFLPPCRARLQRLTALPIQQIRTKKKHAKPPTITVKLIQDVPRFGRKGAFVPISRGRMRSQWFPRKMAEYVSAAELKRMPSSQRQVERDMSFIPDVEQQQRLRATQLELLSAARSLQLLDQVMPESIRFTRKLTSPDDTTFFGSISTGDVAAAIREIAVAAGGDAARVAIAPDMVVFTDQDVEGQDKVRDVGDYSIEIRMRGTTDILRRIVVVVPEQ